MLLDAGMIQGCVVQQYLRFAVGRQLDDSETTFADSLRTAFQMNGYAFRGLLLDYISNDSFALKKEAN
jgi:hypothetical protein